MRRNWNENVLSTNRNKFVGESVKLIFKASKLTLNHLAQVISTKSKHFLQVPVLVSALDQILSRLLNTPGRRATFMHCRRASAALVQASMPREEARSPSWRAFMWPLAKSMWFWNTFKHTTCTCNCGENTGRVLLSPTTQYEPSLNPDPTRFISEFYTWLWLLGVLCG